MSNALTDARRKTEREVAGSPTLMLTMATIGFAVNFWAWALLSPLGPLFREKGTLGTLSESDVALLVAVPVIVGSLGRIVVGALTDRYGGRIMFPLVSAATIVPVLFIGFFAQTSYAALLFGGFFLGIAGTSFAVGVPFVNAWFPPERRGFAVGVFGAGMGGTAISALTTVRMVDAGETATHTSYWAYGPAGPLPPSNHAFATLPESSAGRVIASGASGAGLVPS